MDTNTRTAGRREWIGLAVLALPTLLLSLDMSVLHLAVPHLAADLGPSSTELLWILDIYGFMIAGLLVTMGTLGDRIGRRKLLLLGGAGFGVASIAAAYSSSAEMLIVSRALLGVAGATLMPSTLALISNMFRDPKQRGTAISVWMTCFMGGMLIGPLVGGALLEYFWWGSVFLMGVPVMLLLLLTAPALLPEYRHADAGRLDLSSVALSLAAILPIIYGLKEMAREGVHGTALGALVIGLVVGAVFVRRQRRLADPMLDLRLFRLPAFSAALSIMLVGAITMGGVFLLVNQYLQLVEGLSPLQAGLWMIPQAVAVVVGSLLAPRLAQRFRPEYVLGVGMLIAAAGVLLLTQVGGGGGLGLVVAAMVLASFGMGPQGVLCTEMVIGSVPPEKAGAASAMSETSGEFGIAMGVAIFGSAGTAIYRAQFDVPAGVPESVVLSARESLASAVAVADRLPDQLAAALLGPARDAFAAGLNVVSALAAAIVIVFAVLGILLLRKARPGSPESMNEEGASISEGPEEVPVA
ncbi:MFS transporter [Actinopolymorpha alba]|uniref:MFS transporter n=1 Tax=Actinopolymorpha alba TaxID=533267 RepID=UPI00037CF98A|nr:MFS transporter [Actinopolymorpha alba]